MTTDDRLRDAYARAVDARTVAQRAGCVAPEALLGLVRGEGRDAERLATLDHAMSCPACRDEFELLRALERSGAPEVQQAVEGIRWKRNLSMAIAASAILAIGIGPGRRLLDHGRDDVMRSAGSAVTLVAPDDGASATSAGGDSLTFVWRPVPDAERYVVELLSADGTSTLRAQTTDTTYRSVPDRPLDAGEYRWWVLAQAGDGTERRSDARRFIVRAP